MSNRKIVSKKVAIGLGVICLILSASFGVVLTSNAKTNEAELGNDGNPWRSLLKDLQNAVNNLARTTNQMRTDLTHLQNSMDNLTQTLNDLKSNPSNPQTTNNTPAYRSIDLGTLTLSGMTYRFDIPDYNNPVFCSGFSALSVYYYIDDVSEGNFTLSVSLGSVEWYDGPPGLGGQYGGPMTMEPVGSLNVTVVRDSNGWGSAYTQPVLIQTKAPYFTLGFSTTTNSPDWTNIWVRIRVFAYLRS